MMAENNKDPDLNVGAFLREIWAGKLWILSFAAIGVLCAVIVHVLTVPRYEARMMLAPVQSAEYFADRMQSRNGDGVIVPQAIQDRKSGHHFTRFQALYDGVSVAEILLRDPQIVAALENEQAFRFSNTEAEWDAAKLAAYIDDRVWLDAFGETPLREMKYRHADAEFAAYFLQKIHRVSDQLIRGDLRGQVDERIAYIERVIARSMNPDQRRAMTELLMEQERFKMMVSMDAPVAAQVIEKASASVKPVWPSLYLLYFGFMALGMFLGYIVSGFVQQKEQKIVENYKRWISKEDSANDIAPRDHAARKDDKARKPPILKKSNE